jgi:hypothetical protein
MQASLVVVDEDAGSDVHRVYEAQALLDAAIPEALFYARCYVEESTTSGDVEPQFVAIALHRSSV